jgi:hypothetical protein
MRRPDPTLLLAASLGAACALVPALAMWGFTVDDALISVRYAHHLATGAGYRFNALGPSTDGVTPLPWPLLLAPFARGDALATLHAAKVLGLLSWTGAAAALAVSAARARGLAVASLGLLVTALAFPIGAWAASGMETGVATALATLAAVSLARPRIASLLAGLAASLRPELAPWAVALAIGAAAHDARGERVAMAKAAIVAAAIAVAPLGACSAIRLVAFGRAAPLALMAKPSDLSHGAVYAGAATVAVLTPLFLSLRPGARAISIAFSVHVVSVVLAGGDWMPYARLLVPVGPSLVVAFAAADSSRLGRGLRVGAAAALGVLLAVRAAPAGRHVLGDREDLVRRARPVLAASQLVAALDVGWVSASTDATVVDLAGLTDPQIAALPGGHTSKHVDVGMLLDRHVDTVVVYSDTRVVEARLVRADLFRDRFEKVATLPLGPPARGTSYDVYRRR